MSTAITVGAASGGADRPLPDWMADVLTAQAQANATARGWVPSSAWGRFCNGSQIAGTPPGGDLQTVNWREANTTPIEAAHRLTEPLVAMDESGFAVGSFLSDRSPPA